MTELAAVLVAGLASAASPCLLPLYPGYLAHLAAHGDALAGRRGSGVLGLLVLAGLLATTLAAAFALAALALPFGRVAGVLVPAVNVLLVVLGLLLVAGRNPFERLPVLVVPRATDPYLRALILGAALGPIALPCAGPFLAALLAIAAGAADLAGVVVTFAVFGLGFGLPLVLLSLLAGARQRAITRAVVARRRPLEIVAGTILVAVAVTELGSILAGPGSVGRAP